MAEDILEAKTYKQKIQERYKDKKRQASISISPLKNLIKSQNKIDLDYLREESEIQRVLKLRSDSSFESPSQIDKEIAFFTDVFIDHNISGSNNETQESDKSNTSLKSLSNIQESQTHLASSYLKTEDVAATMKFEIRKVKFNEDLLYYPSIHGEPDFSGLLETNRRSREDEGFYIPEKPKISEVNMNQMKHRLVEENSLHYFDSSGELIGIQMMLSDMQAIKSECDKKFNTTLIPPTPLHSSDSNYLVTERILNILIGNISFDQHNIFTEEDAIAKKLQNLMAQYHKRRVYDLLNNLSMKLDNLRQQKTNLIDGETENDINLTLQIQSIRLQLWREEKYDRTLVKNILKTWLSLKKARENRGATYTDINLIINRVDTDPEKDNDDLERRYCIELDEMTNEAILKYNQKKQAYKLYLRALENGNAEDIATTRRPSKPHMEHIRSELNTVHDEILRPVGEPLIFFELTKLEPNLLDTRKFGISGDIKYSVKFTIDDDNVCVSNKHQMNNNFMINFDYAFRVKLTTKVPKTICVVVSI